MKYDDIFDVAIERVQQEWVAASCYTLGLADQISFHNDEWDLDTGRNKLEPFREYLLKARIQEGVGVILVCLKDGKEGIIEDVSCTSCTTRPDSHRPSGSPCVYLLDVKAVCESP